MMTPEQEKDFALLCLNNRKALPAADEIDALRAQVERLRWALEVARVQIAIAKLWDFSGLTQQELEKAQNNTAAQCKKVLTVISAALAETKTSTEPTKETIKK